MREGVHDIAARMPAAHRIVRIGQVNKLGPNLRRFCKKRGGIFVIVPVRRGVEHAAKASHVIVESWIGAKRGDNRVPRCDQQADEIAQKPVDPFAHHHVFGPHAMFDRQGLAQLIVFGIAILPAFPRRGLHGRNRFGGGAKHALICAKPGGERRTALPFLRFRANERHCRGQSLGETGEMQILCHTRGIRQSDRAPQDRVGMRPVRSSLQAIL